MSSWASLTARRCWTASCRSLLELTWPTPSPPVSILRPCRMMLPRQWRRRSSHARTPVSRLLRWPRCSRLCTSGSSRTPCLRPRVCCQHPPVSQPRASEEQHQTHCPRPRAAVRVPAVAPQAALPPRHQRPRRQRSPRVAQPTMQGRPDRTGWPLALRAQLQVPEAAALEVLHQR